MEVREPTCMSIDGTCWDWFFYFETYPDKHPLHTMEHCRIGDSVKIAKMRRGKYISLLGNKHAAKRANWERQRA